MNNSSIGKIAEMDFAKECIKRGIVPSMPLDDCGGYDFIIEKNGKLVKVQIKSTTKLCKTKKIYRVAVQKGNYGDTPYSDSDFDILSVYIHPLNMWYHIPKDKIKTRGIGFRPDKPDSKYEIHRNWDAIYLLLR